MPKNKTRHEKTPLGFETERGFFSETRLSNAETESVVSPSALDARDYDLR